MQYMTMFLFLLLVMSPSSLFAANRLSPEQIQHIALAIEPGEIIETDVKKSSSTVIYEYEIKKENGTTMELEIDAYSGKILEHKVDKLGPDVKLPKAKISQAKAGKLAAAYIDDAVKGEHVAKVKKVQYTLYRDKAAYEIDVIKLLKEYEVYVDGMNGEILSAKKDN